MNLIIIVCRALANKPRLRLLQAVHHQPGKSVQALAEEVQLAMPAASKHLKSLNGVHLIQMTPSGRFVNCSPPEPGSTNHEFLREVQALLREWFGTRDLNCTLAQVCNSGPLGAAWEVVFDEIVKQVTTFTHLRRLLLLRWLAGKGPYRTEELAAAVTMSPHAARRHLAKLQRRGVVTGAPSQPGAWMIVRTAEPPSRRKLLAIVLRALNRA